MNHMFNGQTSTSTPHAPFFSAYLPKIAFFILLVTILPIFSLASPLDSYALPNAPSGSGNWSVTLHLSHPVTPEQSIHLEATYLSNPAFDGFELSLVPSLDGSSIALHFCGPKSEMPSATEIGVVSVQGPSDNSQHNYLLSTDGGGIMIIIDEF